MARVASLFLPQLAIERLRRNERSHARPERAASLPPVDDDPGACSVPRGGGWRPGARWARDGKSRADVAADAASLPLHQRPPGRELGRRSEPAPPPFRGAAGSIDPPGTPTATPAIGTVPLVLVTAVGQRQLVTAACPAARALGLGPGMAATQARALVADLDVRPADPDADRALLERLALHAVLHWTPIAASVADGLWLDLSGTTHLFGGEERFCRRMHVAAAKLRNVSGVLNNKLYWCAARSEEEADYLCALLNSPVTTEFVRPLMSYGKDERDVHKHVWKLPIPEFAPTNRAIARLAELGALAERLAGQAEVDPTLHFATSRRRIRDCLLENPDAAEIDDLVYELLS